MEQVMKKLITMAFEALEQSVIERDSIREYYINDQIYEAEIA